MHVFLITQYFPPEKGAAASRWGDYVNILIKNDYKVTVLCEAPHYPNTYYYRGYKNKWLKIEKKHLNLTILRSKTFSSNRQGFFKKLAHYLIFTISAIINTRKVKNFDLVIISSPPLFTGIIGIYIKKFLKKDYLFDLRDLWPDSALALKQLSENLIFKLAKKLEYKIYESAKGFIFPVPGFRDYLLKLPKVTAQKPMFELINGVSSDFINHATSLKVNEDKKFTVLYSGNLGLAQDLETTILAAKKLENYDIYFRFIGEGVCKKDIIHLSESLGVNKKVFFHNTMSRKELISWIKRASICIVPLKNRELFNNALPSKMFEYMACEKPIIAGVKGEVAKFVEKSKSGICVNPEDVSDLYKSILYFFNNEEKRKKHGKNGFRFINENLIKEELILKLMQQIKDSFE